MELVRPVQCISRTIAKPSIFRRDRESVLSTTRHAPAFGRQTTSRRSSPRITPNSPCSRRARGLSNDRCRRGGLAPVMKCQRRRRSPLARSGLQVSEVSELGAHAGSSTVLAGLAAPKSPRFGTSASPTLATRSANTATSSPSSPVELRRTMLTARVRSDDPRTCRHVGKLQTRRHRRSAPGTGPRHDSRCDEAFGGPRLPAATAR